MSYFKTISHFENYLQKTFRENIHLLDVNQVMPVGFYIDAAFNRGVGDEFGIALKNNPLLLEEDRFLAWMNQVQVHGFAMPSTIEHIITREFQECLEDLHRTPGCYTFWNERNVSLYVGVSIDLSNRIASSFTERFRYYSGVVYLRFIKTKTCSDAAVCESVLIAQLKPSLNATGKFTDELTLDIKTPRLSKPIQCNVPGEKIDVKKGRQIFTMLKDQTECLDCAAEKEFQ